MKKKWMMKIMSLALVVTMAMPAMNLYAEEEKTQQEATEQQETTEQQKTTEQQETTEQQKTTEQQETTEQQKTTEQQGVTEEKEPETVVPYTAEEGTTAEIPTEDSTKLPLHDTVYRGNPEITDVSMNIEPGSYVESGTVVFTVTARSEMELTSENAYLTLKYRELNDTSAGKGGENSIPLTYKGNGIYEGSCNVEDLEPCEHYVNSVCVYDVEGNGGVLEDAEYRKDYPDYFYVRRDGATRDETYKNVKLCFYEGDDTYNCPLVQTIVKDIPARTTYGEIVGDDAPTLPADPELGEFLGWVRYYDYTKRELCNQDTSIVVDFGNYKNYDSNAHIDFYPLYEKSRIELEYTYLSADGWSYDFDYDRKYVVNSNASLEEIKAMLPKIDDTVGQSHFEDWELVEGSVGDVVGSRLHFEAVYDQYAVDITRTYLNQEGAVERITEERYYPKGTDYKDIIAEYMKVPEDASEEMPVVGWYIYDPDRDMGTSGEIGPVRECYVGGIYTKPKRSYIDLVAEYEEKELEGIKYVYVNPEGDAGNKVQFVLCDKDASIDTVKAEAMKYIPQDHLEGLEYLGDWNIYYDCETVYYDFTYSGQCSNNYDKQKHIHHYYKMLPVYNNKILICHTYDKNDNLSIKYLAVKKGDIIKCPERYTMLIDPHPPLSWDYGGSGDYMDKYVVGSDKYERNVIWEFLYWKEGADDNLISSIEKAEEGAVVEGETDSGLVSKDIFESLKEKKVSLVLTVSNGNIEFKWKIDGDKITDGDFSDIDFTVTKTDINSGNIDAGTINSLSANRLAEQLVFNADGKLDFNPQLTMEISTDNTAEKGVLLQKDGDTLLLSDSALIQDGAITFDIEQKADSVIVYGVNGDTDGDSKVKLKDAMQILQQTSNRKGMNEVQKGFADTDSNDKINLQDVMREMHYISGRSKTVF